ncbi:unnamed protein product [Acanthosepion pharaonis]|uniref:Uncharacterized protein n=1 Tax=Acanthosepion pharaonis TaxID=158019 RepID=A0A812D0H8_ACAPH|nr:unnamed protein product [Sepia pharaonis]
MSNSFSISVCICHLSNSYFCLHLSPLCPTLSISVCICPPSPHLNVQLFSLFLSASVSLSLMSNSFFSISVCPSVFLSLPLCPTLSISVCIYFCLMSNSFYFCLICPPQCPTLFYFCLHLSPSPLCPTKFLSASVPSPTLFLFSILFLSVCICPLPLCPTLSISQSASVSLSPNKPFLFVCPTLFYFCLHLSSPPTLCPTVLSNYFCLHLSLPLQHFLSVSVSLPFPTFLFCLHLSPSP